MKKTQWINFALGVAFSGMAATAEASQSLTSMTIDTYDLKNTLNIYEAGASNSSGGGGGALDTNTQSLYVSDYDDSGNSDGGLPTLTWTFNLNIAGNAQLGIVAEGIDTGENDQVLISSDSGSTWKTLGELVSQGFYVQSNYVNKGLGGFASTLGHTATTESTYDLGFLYAGEYLIQIVMDKGDEGNFWVNEIETSSLTVTAVPIPSTGWMLGSGCASLLALGRRRRR